MIIKLKPGIPEAGKKQVADQLDSLSIDHLSKNIYGQEVIIVFSKISRDVINKLKELPGIEEVTEINKEYKLASRIWKNDFTSFMVRGQEVGGKEINVIAGPCSVESEEQIFKVAEYLHKLGVKFIRGGAYKPRTSPYSFQGLGKEGLKLIRKAADAYDLRVVTEIIDSSLIEEIYPYADILQVGSRNMQNFFFLKQLGMIDKPILLKRGMYAKIDEWLMAAEYILSGGNEKVILCERGIRTFDTSVRNTMDIAAIPLAKNLTHLPVFADPSHGTGRRELINPLSLAAIAAGADGLIIEIHPDPEKALSDGMQSLYLDQFKQVIESAEPVANAVGRKLDLHDNYKSIKKEKLCVE